MPMCPVIRRLTLILAALPPAFLIDGALGPRSLWVPALLFSNGAAYKRIILNR
jgi:hypothetical protein